jgi:hypothetical protein
MKSRLRCLAIVICCSLAKGVLGMECVRSIVRKTVCARSSSS